MNRIDIQRIIEQYPNYKDKVFCRGFLFTDDAIDENDYPFYGLWNKSKWGGGIRFWYHQNSSTITMNQKTILLF